MLSRAGRIARMVALAALVSTVGAAEGQVPRAMAHGVLERSEPRDSATLRTPPAQVRLWFTSEIEPAYSRARLVDASGKEVAGVESRVDPTSRSLLTVALPPLAPGRYRVAWRVLAIDGHVTEGSVRFQVAP